MLSVIQFFMFLKRMILSSLQIRLDRLKERVDFASITTTSNTRSQVSLYYSRDEHNIKHTAIGCWLQLNEQRPRRINSTMIQPIVAMPSPTLNTYSQFLSLFRVRAPNKLQSVVVCSNWMNKNKEINSTMIQAIVAITSTQSVGCAPMMDSSDGNQRLIEMLSASLNSNIQNSKCHIRDSIPVVTLLLFAWRHFSPSTFVERFLASAVLVPRMSTDQAAKMMWTALRWPLQKAK